ncbi:MAG: hypothetical protein DMG07_17060 [Acidobacteria bacterium]|nr:MAG: hypothetical protein DMG07_17060 [Acidobacteriota bacterium]
MNRREFLGASGAGLVAAGVASATPRVPAGPNDMLHIGIVGPGGRGTSLMKECIESGKLQNARLTAVCDIWSLRRDAAAARVKEAHGTAPKVYRRFEEMLADKDVDAVIIATPDHAHGQLLIQAVEAGKDVYCEKPMANVLSEANQALDAVKRTKRIVQCGTQRRAYSQYRRGHRQGRLRVQRLQPVPLGHQARRDREVQGERHRLEDVADGKAESALRPAHLPELPAVQGLLERHHRPVDDPHDRRRTHADRRVLPAKCRSARRHLRFP